MGKRNKKSQGQEAMIPADAVEPAVLPMPKTDKEADLDAVLKVAAELKDFAKATAGQTVDATPQTPAPEQTAAPDVPPADGTDEDATDDEDDAPAMTEEEKAARELADIEANKRLNSMKNAIAANMGKREDGERLWMVANGQMVQDYLDYAGDTQQDVALAFSQLARRVAERCNNDRKADLRRNQKIAWAANVLGKDHYCRMSTRAQKELATFFDRVDPTTDQPRETFKCKNEALMHRAWAIVHGTETLTNDEQGKAIGADKKTGVAHDMIRDKQGILSGEQTAAVIVWLHKQNAKPQTPEDPEKPTPKKITVEPMDAGASAVIGSAMGEILDKAESPGVVVFEMARTGKFTKQMLGELFAGLSEAAAESDEACERLHALVSELSRENRIARMRRAKCAEWKDLPAAQQRVRALEAITEQDRKSRAS